MGLIDQLLVQGDDSLLYQELVKKRAFSGEVNGGINMLGNMFNYKGPMLWTVSLIHDSASKPDDIVSAMESVIAPLRTKPVDQALLDRALVKFRSSLYDDLGALNGFGRADMLASFALFDDNPSRINDIEAQLRKVTPALVEKTAAEYLRPENRTVLVVETKPAEAEAKPGN
jgi:predicted Zn-dependent peptidase